MALPRAIPLAPLHESYENRINYQQQQIQDLTEQCKSLRSQLSRQAGETMELEQTLDAQQQQAKTAIKALQEKLRTEKKVHKDHDEKRNRVARIASLSLQRELCDRHLEEVRLHDIIRQETIATVVREFKITQFAIAEQQKDKILRDTEVNSLSPLFIY
jgi:cysteinyl-tRNA synthetase